MRRVVRRAGQIGGALDRLPQAEASFYVAIVVSVHGDDAPEDEEVGNRSTKARPKAIPRPRFGISPGVTEEPVGRVRPENDHEHHQGDDEKQTNDECAFQRITAGPLLVGVAPDGSPGHLLSSLNLDH